MLIHTPIQLINLLCPKANPNKDGGGWGANTLSTIEGVLTNFKHVLYG